MESKWRQNVVELGCAYDCAFSPPWQLLLAAKWPTVPGLYVVKATSFGTRHTAEYFLNPLTGDFTFYRTIIPVPFNRHFPYGYVVEPDHPP